MSNTCIFLLTKFVKVYSKNDGIRYCHKSDKAGRPLCTEILVKSDYEGEF